MRGEEGRGGDLPFYSRSNRSSKLVQYFEHVEREP